MLRHLKQGILSASTIILSKDIDNYAYKCSSNFYESDVKYNVRLFGLPFPYNFGLPFPYKCLRNIVMVPYYTDHFYYQNGYQC